MGPVHLDLPENVAVAPATEEIPDLAAPSRFARPDGAEIAAGIEILAAAKKPVAVLGSNAMRVLDPDLVRALIDRHALPFATRTMAKGLIDEDHPFSVGCIERGKRQMQRDFLRSADLSVGIGYDTIEVEYEAWICATPLPHCHLPVRLPRRTDRHRAQRDDYPNRRRTATSAGRV